MKLYYHLSLPYLINTYLVGADSGGRAIIIDPGSMDVNLLQLVENHNYYIGSILITNPDIAHANGIKTIMRIYDSVIYSIGRHFEGYPCTCVAGGQSFTAEGFTVEVFEARGLAPEAAMYKIENCLFSGDAISAGRVGESPRVMNKPLLAMHLKETFDSMAPHTLIFPASGPPSTLELEKHFNPDLSLKAEKVASGFLRNPSAEEQ